jgi:tRNA(Ile)-lysidine synthase
VPAVEPGQTSFSPDELNFLFRAVAEVPAVALAVSGGSDSTALMILAQRWMAGRETPSITVLTVDHGLREDSRTEAGKVGELARKLGFDHHILSWDGPKPQTRLQEMARKARYALLCDWCRRQGTKALLTAHTIEDQAETVIMRLARGTGIEGLGGMPIRRDLSGVMLHRPLLHLGRERLRVFLKAAGISWIEDPSNENLKFERIRVRKLWPHLALAGLTPAVLEETAFRARRADRALQQQTDSFIAAHVQAYPEGYCSADLAAFLALPDELRIRVLDRLILRYGPGARASLAGLERLETWFLEHKDKRRRTTLAGCEIAVREKLFILGREPGRIRAEPVPLLGPMIWDGRWRISGWEGNQGLSVCPVGSLSGVPRNKRLPAFVQAGLPAICDGINPIFLPFCDDSKPRTHICVEFDR